jgi:Mrp family chromosome partitioning ATPase
MACIDLDGCTEVARDHALHPRNHGVLEDHDGHARITGPCGDTMEFWLSVHNGIVERISFMTDGCGSSLACGSMATLLSQGNRIADALNVHQKDILKALGGFPPEFEHCALLAANALKAACEDFLTRQQASKTVSDSSRGTCDSCQDTTCTASNRKRDEDDEAFQQRRRLQSRLCRIKHKVVVLSGKGGVGKSTVAVNLAVALMQSGKRVGLLDVDIHGPSVPTMLGLEHETIQNGEEGIAPITMAGMKVMSLGFLLQHREDAVIWRGPRKTGVVRQFLSDVVWGDLDYLIIDLPPGTGDEPLSVCQFIQQLDGAVIVTTPQKVAAVDVRKSITFCRQLHVPILGILENMSGFSCPKCGEMTQILCSGAGKNMSEDMGVPFLGAIPIDPKIAEACDGGRSFVQCHSDAPAAIIMRQAIRMIETTISKNLEQRQQGG